MSPHPFGNELAQVNELAEEFVRDRQEADDAEDARVMAEKGLSSFGAEGYMVEIQELFCMAFGGGTTVGGKEGKMEGVGGSAMWI